MYFKSVCQRGTEGQESPHIEQVIMDVWDFNLERETFLSHQTRKCFFFPCAPSSRHKVLIDGALLWCGRPMTAGSATSAESFWCSGSWSPLLSGSPILGVLVAPYLVRFTIIEATVLLWILKAWDQGKAVKAFLSFWHHFYHWASLVSVCIRSHFTLFLRQKSSHRLSKLQSYYFFLFFIFESGVL